MITKDLLRRVVQGVFTGAVVAAMITACGSGGNAPQTDSSGTTGSAAPESFGLQPDPAVVELVPADYRNRPIVNAIYNDAAPQNFLKDGQLIGVQVDLAQALQEVMGIKFSISGIGNFDTLIPGLQAGRYDLAMSDFGVTLEREKVIDFVYQFNLGTSFAVKNGGGIGIKTGTDLCGHSVGLLAGSYFIPQADALSADCQAAGKPSLQIQNFPTQSAAILAVKNNRVEAYGASSDQIAYLADQDKAGLSAEPFVYAPVPQGIGIPKNSPLTLAVVAGFKQLINNGTYGKILSKWGIESAAITADQVVKSPIPGAK